jgi:glycosyltransferase involved in cell wall biosynthesis
MVDRVDSPGAPELAMKLTVAVLTFKRDDDLAQVLPLLVQQVHANRAPELAIRILVIDNDPDGSAAERVRALGRTTDVPVVYVNETTPGISAARNRALSESADSRLLVFIDDDEHPTEDWLSILLATWRNLRPIAIIGPVVSEYDVEPEPWVVKGEYFARRRMPTGTPTGVASTNNLLLDLDFVRDRGIRFDPTLGLSGGEDTMFSRQLVRAGGLIVWCDEAIVVDRVPADRVTRRWVVLRAVSSGNAWSITSVKLAASGVERAKTRLGLTASGVLRVLGGTARLTAGVVLRRMDLRARGVRTLARGAGMTTGAWGYKYLEYRRPTSGD